MSLESDNAVPEAPSAITKDIGDNVRRIRGLRGVSLTRLSQEANVARGTLHQLEAGRGNPRMDTLYAIAAVLKVALSDLVSSPPPEQAVIRATGGVLVGKPGLTTRLLHRFSLTDGLLEFSDLAAEDSCHVVNAAHPAGIFEHVLITSGVLRTGPVGAEEILRPGDYMRFRGDQPHRYQAVGGPVSGVLLMEYPSQIGTSPPVVDVPESAL